MDAGDLQFGTTLGVILSWGKDNELSILFPTYYDAELGDYPLCYLWNTKAAALTFSEQLYCTMSHDWCLKVWGPRVDTVAKDKAFKIQVTGVSAPKSQTV